MYRVDGGPTMYDLMKFKNPSMYDLMKFAKSGETRKYSVYLCMVHGFAYIVYIFNVY